MTSRIRTVCAAAVVITASTLSAHADGVNVYLSAPFTQTAGSSGLPTSDGTVNGTPNANNTPNTLGFSGVSTETFSQTGGNYTTLSSGAIGATFTAQTGTFTIRGNDQYGGGGQGNYLGVPNGSPVTITLSPNVGYFGLLWCAVDAGNSLTLYDQNNAVIGTFNSTTFSQILPVNSTVKAINNNIYNTNDYYGQPTGTSSTANRQDANEQFAYLNFVAQGDIKISKIVESQGTSAIFESDNYSILTTAPAVLSTSPLVFITAVPEPSTWAMFAVAGVLTMVTIGRRRSRV